MRHIAASSARPLRGIVLACGIAVLATGCSSKERLNQFDFRDRSLTVIAIAPSHAEILSGPAPSRTNGANDPVDAIFTLGNAVANEVSARRAATRLRDAAAAVNVRDRMSDRVLEGAARHLRAVPTAFRTEADYELEIRVRRYGITTGSSEQETRFVLAADLSLFEGLSGRRIWTATVDAHNPVRPLLASGDPAIDGAMSVIALSNLSTLEMERQLELLADFAADTLIDELARALDRARR
jgi:hypothetical protein